jgi:predicted enzyme related to lactoylglutathione lyase
MLVKLYKVVIPVSDLEQAKTYYLHLLGVNGRRMSPREYHYDCGNVVLCCRHPGSEGDPTPVSRSFQQVHLAVEDVEAVFEKAKTAGGCALDQEIRAEPWGDRSFVAQDPFGNTLVFSDQETMERETSKRTSGGPNEVFTTGLVVTFQRASEDRFVASVSRIFDNVFWVKLESSPDVAPPKQGESVQLQYYDATGAFSADAEIVKISPTDDRFVALSIPQDSSEVQRRAAPRVRSVLPVSLSLFVSPEGDEVSEEVFDAHSHDISTGGIRLETEVQLTKGDKLQLSLALSDSEVVTTHAKVMATQQAEVQGKTMTSAGLQFVEMQLEGQITLLQYLIEHEEEQGESPEVESRAEEPALVVETPTDTAEVARVAETPGETPAESARAAEGTGEEGAAKAQLPAIVQSAVRITAEKVVLILLNGCQEVIAVRSVMASKGSGSLTPLLSEPLQLSPGQPERLNITEKLLTLFNTESSEVQETPIHLLFRLDPEPPDQPAPSSYFVRFENGSFTHFTEED